MGYIFNKEKTNHSRTLKNFYLKYFEEEVLDGCMSSIRIMDQTSLDDFSKGDLLDCEFTIRVDTIFKLMRLTDTIKADGYKVVSEPHLTSEGLYKSTIIDPYGHFIHIVRTTS